MAKNEREKKWFWLRVNEKFKKTKQINFKKWFEFPHLSEKKKPLKFSFFSKQKIIHLFFRKKYRYLDSIKEVLLDKASIMDQLVHFNPQDLLNDIYYYDSVLRKIELNNWKDVNLDEFDFFFQEDNYQNEINYEENYFDDNFSNFICQSLTEKIIFSSILF